jgi:hypothetical protein
MWPEFVLRNVFPPFGGVHIRATCGIEGIKDSIARLWRLPSDQQLGFLITVVYEAVRDPSAGRKSCKIAGSHSVYVSVDPGVHLASKHVHELLLALLGVRPRGSRARW